MNAQTRSDYELLNSYLNGDQAAVSELISRHSSRVRDYIRMLVKDADLVDDIFQDTFIKVVKAIDEGSYVDNGKFVSWVLRIAHNKVLDYFRSQSRNTVVNESKAGYDVFATLNLKERSIEDSIVSTQIEADIRRLVDLLPDEQRLVVKMRYYDDMSFKEIAQATDVSINTALGRMRYALLNLRKMIKQKNVVLS